MPQQLTITHTPYKSSRLAVPPSPFSPKLPITPPASPPNGAALLADRSKLSSKFEIPPPPSEPLHWLWQCHLCNRVYQLGVTRRCLEDGHYFCAGMTTVKRSKRIGYKKTIRHKACASEFDYQGWKAWGTWRRDIAEQIEAAEALEQLLNNDPTPLITPDEGRWLNGSWTRKPVAQKGAEKFWSKDCWNDCSYPSECRWGKQYGVDTPVVASMPVTITVPSSPATSPEPESDQLGKTSFDEILLDVPSSTIDLDPRDSSEELKHADTTPSEANTKKPSMDDLLESVKRRKRRSAGQVPSPLASNPPSPTTTEPSPSSTAQVLQKAFDDFELDFRKSFDRAGKTVTSLVGGTRKSAALEDEYAESFVASLRGSKK